MNRFLTAVGTVLGIYLALKIIFSGVLHAPIPASVMKMYMFFVVVGTLLAMTSDDESARELVAPLRSLVFDPRHRYARNIVFVIVPLLSAWITYTITKPAFEAPVEFRNVHPAPPHSMKAFGKKYDLQTLENPYRKLEKVDADSFRKAVADGMRVYYENCHFCHGDKLRGGGHFAQAFNNPFPANFQDAGTIAQLRESYLFWRISTGGPGLPAEGTPWLSPMPVWQNYLTEDEIWKVILYLYDYTGRAPRTMKEERG